MNQRNRIHEIPVPRRLDICRLDYIWEHVPLFGYQKVANLRFFLVRHNLRLFWAPQKILPSNDCSRVQRYFRFLRRHGIHFEDEVRKLIY